MKFYRFTSMILVLIFMADSAASTRDACRELNIAIEEAIFRPEDSPYTQRITWPDPRDYILPLRTVGELQRVLHGCTQTYFFEVSFESQGQKYSGHVGQVLDESRTFSLLLRLDQGEFSLNWFNFSDVELESFRYALKLLDLPQFTGFDDTALSRLADEMGIMYLTHFTSPWSLLEAIRDGGQIPLSDNPNYRSGVYLQARGYTEQGRDFAKYDDEYNSGDRVYLVYDNEVLNSGLWFVTPGAWQYGRFTNFSSMNSERNEVAKAFYHTGSGIHSSNEVVFLEKLSLKHLKYVLVHPDHYEGLHRQFRTSDARLPSQINWDQVVLPTTKLWNYLD